VTVFDTPVFRFDVPGKQPLVEALLGRLKAEQEDNPRGHPSHRVRGWQSGPDLQMRAEAPFPELTGLLARHMRLATEATLHRHHAPPPTAFEVGVTAWMLSLGPGDHVVVHAHPGATWCAVMYLTPATTLPGSGELVLIDPRRGWKPVQGLPLTATERTLSPAPGHIFVFPAFVQHFIHPIASTEAVALVFARGEVRPMTGRKV
jgi:hypothetical protein